MDCYVSDGITLILPHSRCVPGFNFVIGLRFQNLWIWGLEVVLILLCDRTVRPNLLHHTISPNSPFYNLISKHCRRDKSIHVSIVLGSTSADGSPLVFSLDGITPEPDENTQRNALIYIASLPT